MDRISNLINQKITEAIGSIKNHPKIKEFRKSLTELEQEGQLRRRLAYFTNFSYYLRGVRYFDSKFSSFTR